MNAWWGPDAAVWFSLLSLLACLAALDTFAQRGKYEALVTNVFAGAVALGGVFLILGSVALLLAQPWYVVFPLLLVGAVTAPAAYSSLRGARRAYRAAEERKIVAKNI
jgi:hypothetical protein